MNSPERVKSGLKLFTKNKWHLVALVLIAATAFALNFAAIGKLGYCNAYYAAAIKSMTESFHNFFYAAFDPAGVVSVDKPPLGLWVQAIFVLIFGYHGWAMLLPQALSGVGACLMMYALTNKYFGKIAGLISAFVFALTPAVVVASRNNTMDMQLIFVLLLAVWFLFKSIDTKKWRWLFVCAVFVGLGFNIKMLQAYMILPAVVVVYLVFAKEKFTKRLTAGVISLVIMAAVSFMWVLAVDLTPAGERPYVGSSSNNTVFELMIDHNGLERLYGSGGGNILGGRSGLGNMGGFMNGASGTGRAFGNADGGGALGRRPDGFSGNTGRGGAAAQNGTPARNNGAPGSAQGPGGGMGGPGGQMPPRNGNSGQSGNSGQNGAPAQGGAGSFIPFGANSGFGPGGFSRGDDGGMGGRFGFGGGMGGAGNDIGNAGALRLWNSGLYGQAAWLIILALFCILVKIGKFSFKKLTAKQGLFIFWIFWTVTMYGFFSFASFWHRYYLCMFAPGIAGLAGIGLPEMVKAFRDRKGWKQAVLPAALIATFIPEIIFVWSYEQLRTWLAPVMIAAGALALGLMTLYYIKPKKLILTGAAALMLLSLMAAPAYWALTPVLYVEQNSTLPYAGPELASTAQIAGQTANQEVLTSGDAGTQALEKYLVAHYREESYLVVSQRANDVAQFIVDTGLPAVAYGGFLGSDNAITLDKLKALVAEGKVTYFLVSGSGGMGGSELVRYVEENATKISSEAYLGTGTADGTANLRNGIGGGTLYLFG